MQIGKERFGWLSSDSIVKLDLKAQKGIKADGEKSLFLFFKCTGWLTTLDGCPENIL